MANMKLITSVTVGAGGAASVTLPATGTIPQTYTDLKVVASSRSSQASNYQNVRLTFNGSSSGYSDRAIRAYGGSTVDSTSGSGSYIDLFYQPASGATASTFGNYEIYIPNYTSTSNAKSISIDSVTENNASDAFLGMDAGLWSPGTQAAITTITLTQASGTIVEGSTFYLYGISNVTSGTKATGGVVSSDGTYYYHMFPFSGTFTPTTAISADVLCIAGGGGSSFDRSGGGGAGGLLYSSSQSLTTTAYTITIGGGGAGAPTNTTGSSGGNTTITGSGFSTLTATGGGYGAQGGQNGANGGSGGGSGTGGTGTVGQGNNGGTGGSAAPNYGAGAGGGAGAAGDNGTSTFGGNGGNGVNTYSSWANATQTGVNGYYAGGGGGGTYQGGTAGSGGLGGGGAAGAVSANSTGTAGIANTGGGAGGSSTQTNGAPGASGGSGLVIIRYAI